MAPNLGASTTNQAELRNAHVEQGVSLGDYLRDIPVMLSLDRNSQTRHQVDQFVSRHPGRLAVPGSVVDFEYRVVGYRGHPITVRWTAFDGQSSVRLGGSKDYDLLPLRFTAQKKDGDLGSWEIWVNRELGSGRSVYLMIELYDDSAGARLSYLVTDKFVLP